MQMKTLNEVIDQYQQEIQDAEIQLVQTRRNIKLISILRVMIFLGMVAIVFILWKESWWILTLSLTTPLLLFGWLIKRHNYWFNQKEILKTSIKINEQELKAIKYDFSSFDKGEEFIDPSHLYSYDLDVFGKASLFQSINRTTTAFGKETLAQWMKEHLKSQIEIEARQSTVKELAGNNKFRQMFRLLGLLHKGEAADQAEIIEWIETPVTYHKRAFISRIPLIVGCFNLVCLMLTLLELLPFGIFGIIFSTFIILSFIFTKKITKLQYLYDKKIRILSTYAKQIDLTEKEVMQSELLVNLQSRLSLKGKRSSQILHQLAELMNGLDQRNNVMLTIFLNGFMFWELWQFMRIEKWKETYAPELPNWLEVIGEIDAYCSLGTFAYNHPDYLYPTISSNHFCMKAKSVGHPLMNAHKCVRNNVHIEQDPSFVIITGANMAGKSTYLRTIGINYLLACIGAPVWAEEMNICPAQLITSLRTSDSLSENESYFFAELKRLQLIISKLNAGEKLFIILDEILKGTNSMDKQKGSLALLKQFMGYNTNGIIATHDLMLGGLAEVYPTKIRNYCFEADIKNDELNFSYEMREGIAKNMNACFLMKKMGIAVIDND